MSLHINVKSLFYVRFEEMTNWNLCGYGDERLCTESSVTLLFLFLNFIILPKNLVEQALVMIDELDIKSLTSTLSLFYVVYVPPH